jgi:hypothetical protein
MPLKPEAEDTMTWPMSHYETNWLRLIFGMPVKLWYD